MVPSRPEARTPGGAQEDDALRRLIGYALALLLCTAAAQPAVGQEKSLLVFYDPDANHQAIVNITSWFNSYLRNSGSGLTFQPVQDQATFNSLVAKPTTKFVIVSSAYLKESGGRGLTALMVPSLDGDVYYRKKLFDKGVGQPGDLSNANIAATLSGGDAKGGASVLANLRRAGIKLDNAHVIPVSKDIDALLALSFGQVQAALVTPSSIEVLKRINPAAVATFRAVLETKPILRSPLCAVTANTNAGEREALIRAIAQMGNDEEGRKAMRTLGFDQWVDFDPAMVKHR